VVISGGFSAALVDEFCKTEDTLGVDGVAGTAVIARIHSGWFINRISILLFTDRMAFLPANQECQSIQGKFVCTHHNCQEIRPGTIF